MENRPRTESDISQGSLSTRSGGSLRVPSLSRQNSTASTGSGTQPHLPEAAMHSYLGNAFQELLERSILQSNQVYEMLLLPLPDVIVFPTETVPLRIQNREFILKLGQLMQEARNGNREIACHIGIVRLLNRSGTIEKIGTTVEIKSTHNNTTMDDEELIVTAKGRHRFEIVKVKRTTASLIIAEVKILSDYSCKQILHPSAYTPFPHWVYDNFSPKRLARLAYELFESNLLWKGEVNTLKRWGPLDPELSSRGSLGAEEDPVGFSFYLAANLPNPSSDLQTLLKAEDVIERLKLEINFLTRSKHLKTISCLVCNQVLACKGDIFNVPGAEGCAGAYVNCYG
jgi:ATP-dependent Lon protease